MKWSNIWLILDREVRDQLRDRRTLFMIGVLPLILYPLLGIAFLQVAQFLREHPTHVLILGAEHLPAEPKLIVLEEGKDPILSDKVTSKESASLVELTLWSKDKPLPKTPEAVEAMAKELIDNGDFEAVVFIQPDFNSSIQKYRQGLVARAKGMPEAAPADITAPKIFFNAAKDKSKIAFSRMARVIDSWRDELVRESFESSQIPLAAARPFELTETDVAEEQGRQAAVWSKILPFVVMIWALTGAFYPAVDLCAGEKERGTLETLLSSPAERSEIVFGKLGTVIVFSMATALLNLFSLCLTGQFVFSKLQAMGGVLPGAAIGAPPLEAAFWLIVALVPIAALFSALSLAIAAMARSTREGQYYLMPLLLSAMPLMMLPMLPAMELDLGTSLIPVTGVMLLLRTLIEGQYFEAARYALPVIAVTTVCVLLAVRWAIDQFNNEDVLFRESERFDLSAWIVSLVRERGDTPSAAEAVFAGLMLLFIRFVAGLYMKSPHTWNELVTSTLVMQLALIATPILLMTIMLTRSWTQTLLLRIPHLPTIPAAILLAVALHPFVLLIGQAIQKLYPMPASMRDQVTGLQQLFSDAPSFWLVLGMFALVPAICEELACRGFILAGLRHTGHRWLAIAGSAVIFGAMHLILQQQINAAIFGLVIGYLALKTESILPAMAFHCMHNSLALSISLLTPAVMRDYPWLGYFVEITEKDMSYRWPVLVVCGLTAVALLWWFKSLPYNLTEEEELEESRDREPAVTTLGREAVAREEAQHECAAT